MSDDVEFGSDIMSDDLQFSFDSEISLNDTNKYQHNVLILNGKCCEDIVVKILNFLFLSYLFPSQN
jgi:hypothetical protein